VTKMRLPLDGPGTRLEDPDTWTNVHVCESLNHEPRHAMRRLFLVQGPVEYCEPCAAKMLAIYASLGVHCHVEDLRLRQVVNRLTAAE